MGPIDGRNEAEVPYFSLQEYVNRIHVEKNVLEHMEETNNAFDEYLKSIRVFDEFSLGMFWIDLLYEELNSSFRMGHRNLQNIQLIDEHGLFFDTLSINHKRIKELHEFVIGDYEDYRKCEVRVSTMTKRGEIILWRGALAKDIERFMNDFIRIYKSRSLSVINTNPFLKSSLIHLLLARIQPFSDGNHRTARILHNMKFTSMLNDIYGMRLKISPLNLSPSILVNQISYADRINHIYFDLDHDSNEEINKWFDFMLNMVDEQIYYVMAQKNKVLPSIEKRNKECVENKKLREAIAKMKIKK